VDIWVWRREIVGDDDDDDGASSSSLISVEKRGRLQRSIAIDQRIETKIRQLAG
jgi:hypothetical protein